MRELWKDDKAHGQKRQSTRNGRVNQRADAFGIPSHLAPLKRIWLVGLASGDRIAYVIHKQ